MATIEVKAAKTMMGRKTGGYVAVINGRTDVHGDTATIAKANMLDYLAAIELNHATRRYLFCGNGKTILVVHWSNVAWAYDIIDAERSYPSGCIMSTTDLREAIKQATAHAEQSYNGVLRAM